MGTDNRDARLGSRQSSDNRRDRDMDDRPIEQNREATDEARLELFRNAVFQSTLPPLPQIDGWHICWLTTNNPRDSIQWRTRLGYEPVKASEVMGWQGESLKTGEYAGCIGVNEMVAFKIPMRLYLNYMRIAHHEQPMEEEKKLSAIIDVIANEARTKGAQVLVGEGSAELGKSNRRPRFEHI
jgi:hypothetical protein